MALSLIKGALIILNAVGFVTKLIFNKEATKVSKVFPRKTGEVSDKVETDLTPAAATFAIWGVIYFFQASWITYSLSLLFRPSAPDVLPVSFYLAYLCASVLNITWLLVWARRKFALASAILVFLALSLATCLFYAYSNLYLYVSNFSGDHDQINTDMWCQRLFVQNGIMLYTAWVAIASCINFAIFLQTGLGVPRNKAGTIALTILLSIATCWFFLENFLFRKYAKYTFSEYFVLVIGLRGVLKKQWIDGRGNQKFVLAIFIFSCLMLVARFLIIFVSK